MKCNVEKILMEYFPQYIQKNAEPMIVHCKKYNEISFVLFSFGCNLVMKFIVADFISNLFL